MEQLHRTSSSLAKTKPSLTTPGKIDSILLPVAYLGSSDCPSTDLDKLAVTPEALNSPDNVTDGWRDRERPNRDTSQRDSADRVLDSSSTASKGGVGPKTEGPLEDQDCTLSPLLSSLLTLVCAKSVGWGGVREADRVGAEGEARSLLGRCAEAACWESSGEAENTAHSVEGSSKRVERVELGSRRGGVKEEDGVNTELGSPLDGSCVGCKRTPLNKTESGADTRSVLEVLVLEEGGGASVGSGVLSGRPLALEARSPSVYPWINGGGKVLPAPAWGMVIR